MVKMSVYKFDCLAFSVKEPPHDKTNKMASAQSDQSFHCQVKGPMFLYADNEDSDQIWLMDTQADLSFCWAHSSFCWFCHEAANFF